VNFWIDDQLEELTGYCLVLEVLSNDSLVPIDLGQEYSFFAQGNGESGLGHWFNLHIVNGGEVVSDFVSSFGNFEDESFEVFFENNSTEDVEYFWNFGDGTTSNEENPIHVYSSPGVYLVTLEVTNECGVTSFSEDVLTLDYVNVDDFLTEDIVVFSRDGNINIVWDTNRQWTAKVFNISGQDLDISKPLSKGMYVVQIFISDLNSVCKKIIIY
jgi:hypothetical protein